MRGSKPWYQSTTIQGGIILAASIAAQKFDIPFEEEEKAMLTEIVINAGELVGLAMTFWGRIKASSKVTFKKAA